MLVSILIWVFAVLMTRRAFRIGKTIEKRGFWFYLFGLSLALGIAGMAGIAVNDSRLPAEEIAIHGLQRSIGFFVLSLPLWAVGWLIGRMNRSNLATISPVRHTEDATFEASNDSVLTQQTTAKSPIQIVPKRRIDNQTPSLALNQVHKQPDVLSPPSLYLVTTAKARIGPIPRSEVLRQISEGMFSIDDFCWSDGMSDWSKIGEVFPSVERNGKLG